MISLNNDRFIVVIDPEDGARIASIVIDGFEILRDSSLNVENSIFGWGSFAMVPYAGRIRNGKFIFNSIEHQLNNLADFPHALHGSSIYQSWKVVSQSEQHCDLETQIDQGWPFRGSVTQKIQIQDSFIEMSLVLTATENMPAWIGFHPWFRKEISGQKLDFSHEFSQMFLRDSHNITTAEVGLIKKMPWDDCFISDGSDLTLNWGEVLKLKLESNTKYWVVYSEPTDSICLEPQTSPPNAIELGKHSTLSAGDKLELFFKLSVN